MNEDMLLVSELVDKLTNRFNSNDVWYQVSDSEVPIYFVGFESLVYYKVQNGEVIWKSLY